MPKHFTDKEVEGLDPRLVDMIDWARDITTLPMVLTETLASGGHHVPNTAHQRGKAVDFKCISDFNRKIWLEALLKVGFKRIGLYDRHIHVDNDETLPQGVIWIGVSH